MKEACAGVRQNVRPNASSSMKKFFTASQIAHPPRRIQGKWERAMKRPKANFNQTIETKLSFSTASGIIIATPERFSFVKNIAIVILLMGAIALGTFCLHQIGRAH